MNPDPSTKQYQICVDIRGSDISENSLGGYIAIREFMGRTKLFPFKVTHPFQRDLQEIEIYKEDFLQKPLIVFVALSDEQIGLQDEGVIPNVGGIMSDGTPLDGVKIYLSLTLSIRIREVLEFVKSSRFKNSGFSGITVSSDEYLVVLEGDAEEFFTKILNV